MRPKYDYVRDGLVLYLDAANPSSFSSDSSIFKSLTNNYTETRYGTVTYDNISVDYTSGAGIITRDEKLKFRSEPFSVCVMFYINSSLGTWRSFPISCWNTGASPGTNEWIIGSMSSYMIDKYGFTICTSTAQAFTASTKNKLFEQTEYYLVGVRDGSTISMYCNGEFQNSVNDSSIAQAITDTSNNIYIGSIKGGDLNVSLSCCFNGKLSAVQIYNKALSSYEIRKNYNFFKNRF